MNEIILPAAVLRDALTGALVAVATDKILPAFNCVRVAATPSGVDFVGSDRYALIVGTVMPSNSFNMWHEFDALIHMDDVKLIISELKAALRVNKNLGVKLVHNGYDVTLHGIPDITVTAKDLNRQHDFPRYDRLLPDSPPDSFLTAPIGFNAANLAKLSKVPAVKDSPVSLQFYGLTRPLVASVKHDAIKWQVLIMPVRLDHNS